MEWEIFGTLPDAPSIDETGVDSIDEMRTTETVALGIADLTEDIFRS